jgi:hypothetical protein
MPHVLVFLIVLLAFIAWVSLPFLPAVFELLRPRDATPLTGVGSDAGDLTFLADGFRRYASNSGLLAELDARYGVADAGTMMPFDHVTPDAPDAARPQPRMTFQLRDKTNVRVLRSDRLTRDIVDVPGRPRVGDRAPDDSRDIIVIDAPTQLPEQLAVDSEVFARADFVGGAEMRVRALLAVRNADLAIGTVVVRWVHADGALLVGRNSSLFGRATSNTEMRLGPGVRFERIKAPRIIVGADDDEFVPPPTASVLHGEPWARPMTDRITRMSADTLRVHGDLTVPPHVVVSSNLVVVGTLTLEQGCQLRGSAKATKGIRLAGANIVTGSLTSMRDIHIGARSHVAGPVIGEALVHVHEHAMVGTPQIPTTITAPRVVLARGTAVYGAVAAREGGSTE